MRCDTHTVEGGRRYLAFIWSVVVVVVPAVATTRRWLQSGASPLSEPVSLLPSVRSSSIDSAGQRHKHSNCCCQCHQKTQGKIKERRRKKNLSTSNQFPSFFKSYNKRDHLVLLPKLKLEIDGDSFGPVFIAASLFSLEKKIKK